MLKVFEEIKSYNENYILGAERVFKYRKIKFDGEFFEDPHRNGRFEEMSHLLYGDFIDNINEDKPYQKSKNGNMKNMKYKSGIEIMGMKPNKTKYGKYKCDGISLVELKKSCIMNGIKGYSKCDKLELVKLLMKVDSQDTPIKEINLKKTVKEVKPVVEEVELVEVVEEVEEVKPVVELVEEVKPIVEEVEEVEVVEGVVEEVKPVVEEVKPLIIDFKPIVEPKQKDESYANYFYTLFGETFVYCGIHLSTEGFKPCGKPKKKPFFPFGYDKIDKPLIKPFKSKDKKHKKLFHIYLMVSFFYKNSQTIPVLMSIFQRNVLY